MDSLEIYNEARLIAKYAKPTDDCVGLIFSKGCSFSFDDLYFKNDEYLRVRNESGNKAPGNGFSIRDKEKFYLKRKEDFLNSFPKPDVASGLTDDDIEAALMAEIKYNEYKCIGIEVDELDAIFRKYGQAIAESNSDMGVISIVLENEKINSCSILVDYFGCDEIYLFCNDGDQHFPSSIMVLMK